MNELSSPRLSSRPYQDEPEQLPSGVVGKNAYLRLGFQRRGERSALIELDRRVPLMAQKALYWDAALPDMPCVFIITTSGSRPARRPLSDRNRRGPRYTCARHDAGGHQNPFDGRKLCGADPGYRVGRERLPGIPA